MTIESTPLAIRYHSFGKPGEVLVAEPIEVAEPEAGQVCIKLLNAAINPSDMGMIMGSYGKLKELPAVGGREGVGEIVACGEGVSALKVGDWVRMPEDEGCWRSQVTVSAEGLMQVPNDLPAEQAAMAFVNPPTAYCLLKYFGNLKSGDWLIQNAGNSAVGFCVTRLAKHLGLNVICVVRDAAKWETPLKEAGAAHVVAEESGYAKQIKELTGGAPVKLGLNSIGGESVSNIIKCMGESGTVVTFGGMVGDPVRFPTRFLIFNDVRLVGFWMDKWFRTHSAEEANVLMTEVFNLIRDGVFQVPVEKVYPLSEGKEAVIRALQGSREGKVLIGE